MTYNWKKIIDDWSKSNLSIAEYCRRKQIPKSSFYTHMSRLKEKNPMPSSGQRSNRPRLVEVSSSADDDKLTKNSPEIREEPPAMPTIKITTQNGTILEVFLP